MKSLPFFLALLFLALPSWSQEGNGVTAERERIKTERARADAAFAADEKACYAKFAVNDCINAAKSRRRVVLAELRRQETAINDAERQRKTADRMRELQERSKEREASSAGERGGSAAAPERRGPKPAGASAERPAQQDTQPPKGASRQRETEQKQAGKAAAREEAAEDAARNRVRQAERLTQAQQRKAAFEKRQAERKKPAAPPLPVPP